MHGVGEVSRPRAKPIAGQVGGIDAVARLGKVGRKVAPVIAAASKAVHQHYGRPIRRPLNVVVDPVA